MRGRCTGNWTCIGCEKIWPRNRRSESYFNPDHKSKKREGIRRLLFRLAEDVFCYAQEFELTVFASTLKQALQHAERLSVKYGKDKPAEQPGFYLLKVGAGSIDAECVKITRQLTMSAADLELHHGRLYTGRDLLPSGDRRIADNQDNARVCGKEAERTSQVKPDWVECI
jgi:hypothetical protein